MRPRARWPDLCDQFQAAKNMQQKGNSQRTEPTDSEANVAELRRTLRELDEALRRHSRLGWKKSDPPVRELLRRRRHAHSCLIAMRQNIPTSPLHTTVVQQV